MAAIKLAPLPAADEEQVIKSRFLNQVSVARGEPPFKRLTKRFIQLCEDVEKSSDDEAIQRAHEALLREINMLEVQAEKQDAILKANQREQDTYQSRQQQLAQQIEQAKQDIELRKQELEQARIVRQHNEEYEVLRHLLVQHPARATTQQEIDAVKRDIDKITSEGNKTAAAMQRRRQQFALLLHVIEELQRTIEDPEDEQQDMGAVTAMPGTPGPDNARMDVDV